jgi:hypothetical protein
MTRSPCNITELAKKERKKKREKEGISRKKVKKRKMFERCKC